MDVAALSVSVFEASNVMRVYGQGLVVDEFVIVLF